MPEPAHPEQPLTEGCAEQEQNGHAPGVPPPFLAKVDVVPDGGRTSVAVRGEFDLDAGQQLAPALHQALARSVSGIDLHLNEVEFCDCSGLNLLLGLREIALAQGKTVVVRSSSPVVERLLYLSGTRELFTDPAPDDEHPPRHAVHGADRCEDTDQDLRRLVAQLRRAMQTRPTIDLARGILMVSFSLSPEGAWDVLVTASQNTNTKLYRLAGDLVSAAQGTTLPQAVREQLAAAVAEANATPAAAPPQPEPPPYRNTTPGPLDFPPGV